MNSMNKTKSLTNMKTFLILIIIILVPLSVFSQDEFTYFKSLCNFRKENKIKAIYISSRPNSEAHSYEYFDENGFPTKLKFEPPTDNYFCYCIENISVNQEGLFSYYIITDSEDNSDTTKAINIFPSRFLESPSDTDASRLYQFKFDSANRLSEITTIQNNKPLVLKKIFYFQNNSIQSVKFFDASSNLFKSALYFYNSNNLLNLIIYTYNDDLSSTETHYYYYNFY